MIRVLSAVLTASVCLFPPALVTAALAEDHDDHSHHEGGMDGVRTVHAWAQATTAKTAFVFVDIENNSDRDIAITGGESEIAASVELVGFRLKDGEPDYVVLPPVPITQASSSSKSISELYSGQTISCPGWPTAKRLPL